jgi:ATP-dependent Zn protease
MRNRRIIDEQYADALAILVNNRSLLQQYAQELLKKEIMEGHEIDRNGQAVRRYAPDPVPEMKTTEKATEAA